MLVVTYRSDRSETYVTEKNDWQSPTINGLLLWSLHSKAELQHDRRKGQVEGKSNCELHFLCRWCLSLSLGCKCNSPGPAAANEDRGTTLDGWIDRHLKSSDESLLSRHNTESKISINSGRNGRERGKTTAVWHLVAGHDAKKRRTRKNGPSIRLLFCFVCFLFQSGYTFE